MKGEKESSMGCTQLQERIARRKAGLTPVGLWSVVFPFAVAIKLA